MREHIDHVYVRLIKYTGLFYTIRDLMSWMMLKMFYFAFIGSHLVHLLYGVEIYGNSCGTYFTKLTTLNNKILRILQNQSYETRNILIYIEHIVLTVLTLREFRVLLLMRKFVHHKDKLSNVLITILYQMTLFICMILGIELTYIDTELTHLMAIAV